MKVLWVTYSAKIKINMYKMFWPPEFRIHIDGRDVPMSEIEAWPVVLPDNHELLNLDKMVRSEYNPKHNPNMG